MVNADPRTKLLQLANKHGASLAGLSELIGRNSTYLQQFIRKGSPRKLEENDRRTLAQFFGIDERELRTGEDNSSLQATTAPRSDWIEVPRLALGASAGPGALADEEQPIGVFRHRSHRSYHAQPVDSSTPDLKVGPTRS